MRRNPNPVREAEIFAAAVRVFQQKGYHATSMQDIANAVGLQKPSLYHYIRSKEELLFHIFDRGVGPFTAELEEIAAADLRASDKLRRAITTHLRALCAQIELFAVYLREQQFLSGSESARVRAEGGRHGQLLTRIVEEGIRGGEFRRLDPTVTALAILGMCNWLYQWYSPAGRLQPEAIANIFCDLVLTGLVKPPRPSRQGASKPKKTRARATRRRSITHS